MQRNIFIVLVVGIILGLIGSFIFFEINNKGGFQNIGNTSNKASISGTLNINGVVPQGATLTLYQKQVGSKNQFTAFAQIANPSDMLSWDFNGGIPNASYEIKAVLSANGKEVVASDPIFVTAPATDEKIKLEISSSIGESATISGTVGLNGYIPTGATITVEGKKSTETNYIVVASNLSAKDNQFISYTTAVSGQEYDVRAVLYNSSGTQIGVSDVLTVIAPAENETLSVNSNAQAPVTPTPTSVPAAAVPPVSTGAIISGNINFNGAALPNSRIVIFQRPINTQNYQVAVDNITPVNGASWQWNGAVSGQWYNLFAVLKQRQSNGTDQDITLSTVLTVAAPAANESFTINSGFSLPAPGGNVSVTCGNLNGQTWGATLNFPASTNAQSYWLQVGVTNGGIELMNQTMNASSNATQQVSANLQNGTTYYIRYAYATVQNLGAGSSQFSPFSQTSQVRCSQ